MPTIATPRSVRSRPSAASPAATCWTYGQWLQMKVTTSAGPVSSSRLTVAPVAGSGSANRGAGVPRASIVDSVAMLARVGPLAWQMNGQPLPHAHGWGGRPRQGRAGRGDFVVVAASELRHPGFGAGTCALMEKLFTPVKLLGPESMPCPRRADEERPAERTESRRRMGAARYRDGVSGKSPDRLDSTPAST